MQRKLELIDVVAAVIGLPLLAAVFLALDIAQRLAVRFRPRSHRAVVLAWASGVVGVLRLIWRVRFEMGEPAGVLDDGKRPFVIFANHGSPLDIPILQVCFRRRQLAFVARAGLERGIPCVSYFLRNGGGVSVSPDRIEQSLEALRALGGGAGRAGRGVVVFPEGRKTRASYGVLSPFRSVGPLALLHSAPGAHVMPVALEGTHRLWAGGWSLPRVGACVRVVPLGVVPRSDGDRRALTECERRVRAALGGEPAAGPGRDPDPSAGVLPQPSSDGTRTWMSHATMRWLRSQNPS